MAGDQLEWLSIICGTTAIMEVNTQLKHRMNGWPQTNKLSNRTSRRCVVLGAFVPDNDEDERHTE